jgi:hypothetical protein
MYIQNRKHHAAYDVKQQNNPEDETASYGTTNQIVADI